MTHRGLYRTVFSTERETLKKKQTRLLCWALLCLKVEQLSCNQDESQPNGQLKPEESRTEKWKGPEPLIMTLNH